MKRPSAPVILITGGFFPQEGRLGINLSYLRSVERAGGIPLVGFPSGAPSSSSIATMLDRADGIILSGGPDVFPGNYGEEPLQGISRVDPDRDAFELLMIRQLLQSKKPILGICRGMQILNVAEGGSLFQDLVTMNRQPAIAHAQTAPKTSAWHSVQVLPDSLLDQSMQASIKRGRLEVNSIHHQAVKQLAQGWLATSWADDGTIESMEFPGPVFRLAVQWHPEAMEEHLPIFESLIRACR
jgi:putative glutamine amidotransferase